MSASTDSLLLAIVGHLVGDYLLQNDWMALNKKKPTTEGFLACSVHATIWTYAVCIFSGWGPSPVEKSSVPYTFLFLTHFFQDRTNVVLWWMTKVNRQQKFATGTCAPWSIIVVDNVWHIVALWLTWRFIA